MSETHDDPDRAFVRALARDIGLTIPEPCLPGVMVNRDLLRQYADLVNGFALPDTCEPAFDYQP
ncbi:DUF4089 domain-containing protein [Gluconacetobacter tumulisoli]|uniref:DUF4089 domain-containing protein n=1 Tax=Gluconacetobacter tumulisoli TaxID=1286189 RepID=A0A7W4PL36_9PROT|nr:DUF4089 domain-containing protein [Gluconacetobacter tumulisoli]MBB2201760.1 DUF4089 domain-containing protein [Gluconacetobacter tumulisoli]